MRRVILLLPNPDILQVANCHKYITRKDKTYSDIYTLTTIKGQCADVDKILAIGHGHPGGFETAKVGQVAKAIVDSGMKLTDLHKIAFDTCYAGANVPNSALELVEKAVLKLDKDALLYFVGTTGPSITIGAVGDKRLVVDPNKLKAACDLQSKLLDKHKVNLFEKPSDWKEGLPSNSIKVLANKYYQQLKSFAIDFRSQVEPLLDKSDGRKVKV